MSELLALGAGGLGALLVMFTDEWTTGRLIALGVVAGVCVCALAASVFENRKTWPTEENPDDDLCCPCPC